MTGLLRRLWSGAVCAAASGVLFLLSIDMGPLGALALIAPVPVLLYALTAERMRSVAVWAFAAGFVARLNLVQAYVDVFPPMVLAVWMGTLPLWFMGVVLATRWIARGSLWPALFSYPLLTTASEFLFSTVSPHGSFGALGYAMSGVPPVLQLASLGGVAALTFFASFVPMVIVLLIRTPDRWRTILLAAGLPAAAVLLFGASRLTEHYDGKTRVAEVAIDSLQDDELASELHAMANAVTYSDVLGRLADRQPKYILLPEKSLIQRPGWIDTGMPLQAAADRLGIPIVAGFDQTLTDGSQNNVARLFRPQGAPSRYLKRRLIPGLEDGFNAGTESFTAGALGIAICKDMDFAPMIRDYGRRGVRLMLVPAWDFRADTELHARMALVRGVENGFAVARAAADGVLTISDAYGRLIAETPTDAKGPTVLVADVGMISSATIYDRVGDLFGWLTVAGAVLVVASALLRRRAD